MIYYNMRDKSELEQGLEAIERSNAVLNKNFELDELSFPCNIAIEQVWENKKVVKVTLVSIDNFIEDNDYKRSIEISNDLLYKDIDVILSSFDDSERGMKVVNFEKIKVNGLSYNNEGIANGFRTNIGEVMGSHIRAYKLT